MGFTCSNLLFAAVSTAAYCACSVSVASKSTGSK